ILFLLTAHKIPPGKLIAFERLVSGTFFAFVLVEQLKAKHSLFKADRIPYFERAGKLTYVFYLFHSLLIYYICKTFEAFHWSGHIGGFLAYFLLLLVLNSGLSILSYRYFEKPLLNL